jgi:OPT family oligopeptide transporter
MGVYYGNLWDAKDFPFMSTTLFSQKSTTAQFLQYNQTRILDHNYRVDPNLVKQEGLPRIAATHAFGMTLQNISIMAAITHMCLWHWSDISIALELLKPLKNIWRLSHWNLKFWKHEPSTMTREEADEICPHYGVMQSYKDVPNSWFGIIWFLAAITGLIASRISGSTLEVWAFFVAILLAGVLVTPFAALTAMFGFYMNVQPLIQMIGAYMLPGRPLANLYFSTYGFNSLYMAKNMLKDLKLGQYVHLAPRVTFTVQIVGTAVGCIMSYIMMEKITTERKDILLAVQGTNVWSGQHIQSLNAAAITWGGLAKQMYSVGARYQSVSLGFLVGLFAPLPLWFAHHYIPGMKILRMDLWNIAMIAGYMVLLTHGTTSGYTLHFIIGFFSQFYLRKYRTNWFIKYNYILSAGLDGGAQVINFILTFSVFGAAGKVINFPAYFGNHWQKGNLDYCFREPGLHKGRKGGDIGPSERSGGGAGGGE